MYYQLLADRPFSVFSRPLAAPEASYEIHLIKSDDPEYLPADMEVWPIYHGAIIAALHKFPDALAAALAAFRVKRQELKGRENRDVPRGTGPLLRPRR